MVFDTRKFFAQRNRAIVEKLALNTTALKDIQAEMVKKRSGFFKLEFQNFFYHSADFLLKMIELESKLDDDYFQNTGIEELRRVNYNNYAELLPEKYDNSFANPAYCHMLFGAEFGSLMSYYYTIIRSSLLCAYQHKQYRLCQLAENLVAGYKMVRENPIVFETLKQHVLLLTTEKLTKKLTDSFEEKYNPKYRFVHEIVENADLTDFRYLYRYGLFVTDFEAKTAKFLNKYSKVKIAKLAEEVAAAYVRGFTNDGKDMSKKSTILISYCLGQEMIIRELIKELAKYNLKPVFALDYLEGAKANKQYSYDHRFDSALYFDKKFASRKTKSLHTACEQSKELLSAYSGPLFFEKFGEIPFAPVNKKENLTLSPEQQKVMQEYKNSMSEIMDGYIPSAETSFCIIAFPSPEIGAQFEKIFEDTLEINMQDSKRYEVLQDIIIEALDKADFVHVKGKGSNQTDIKVKLPKIKHHDKQTNFCNCVADVNIPVGEVFTSPQLKGTNGVLHLKETYLNDFKYVDLKLVFKDGYITEYHCKNFTAEAENKKYIEENLIFPHATLPLGEFAIGTNTMAYVVAKKYNIVDLLPILIVEKMGPHFAIGDTCYSWQEDRKIFNHTTGKEIIAKDNERSKLRTDDVNKAYTNCHTDITLPYDALEFITAVDKDGNKVDIIADGRFVLAGVEELNRPFMLL